MKYFKSMKKPLLLLFLFCLVPLGISAQSIIKGVVKDVAGEPIIGATVRVVGTQVGSVTDLDGNFSVQASSQSTLQISYVGYESQTVKVAGRNNIVVTLKEEDNTLNDVVVVGYGTMKKSDISGSIATVDQTAVMKRVPQNIGQALQGSAAGVYVAQQDGSPDGKSAIRIRGVGTISGTAAPLFVVDGIMVGTSADFVNPSDIERIEILKDASACAIYGSQGANGVVMITTKRGKAGHMNVNVTADFGLQTLPFKLDVMGIDSYAKAIREAKANDKGMFINQVWDAQYDGKRNGIDWQKEMTHAALRQQYGISLNGGAAKTSYNLSLGYLDVDGTVVNTRYKRFTTHANVTSKVAKYFEIGADINYTHSETFGSNMSLGNNQNMSSLRDFASMTPTLDYTKENVAGGQIINVNLKNPDGTYGLGYQNTPNGWEGNTDIGSNPYASQMENGDRARNGIDRIQTTAFVDLIFLDNKTHRLDWKTVGSLSYTGNQSSDYTGGRRRFNYIDGQLTEVFLKADQSYALSLNNSHSYELAFQTYLTYNLNLGVHNLTLMGGNEVNKNSGQWVNVSARNFPSVMNRAIKLTETPDDIQGDGAYNANYRTISYFARASYVLMDRYILTGTIRRDGSSNFGPGHHWDNYPSLAGAWRISEEPFMKDIKFINNLKLRLGYGETGNAGIEAGRGVARLSVDGAYNFYGENGVSGAFGGTRDRQTGWYANDNDEWLHWERTRMTNIGIDFAFLNDWDVTLDYFIKGSKGMLLWKQFRPSVGTYQVYTNYGDVRNKGFEFAIGYHKQINKDFGINVRLNGSTIKNEIKQMGSPVYNTASANSGASAYDGSQVGAVDGNGHWDNHSVSMEGAAVGSYFGYVTDGIIKDEADLAAYKAYMYNGDDVSKCDDQHPLQVGDMKFKDLNDDHKIDQNDRKVLGNGFPKFNYGLNVSATYKDFDFNLYMYGVLGQDILSYSAMKMCSMGQLDDQTTPNILTKSYNEAFRDGSGSLPRLSILDPHRNYRVSDMWVKNGNFLRISNIQVGYTLPQDIAKKLSIVKARVYVGVSNLLTISPYNKYGDPECGSGSVLYTGLDTGRYPQPRTWMAGLNVTF